MRSLAPAALLLLPLGALAACGDDDGPRSDTTSSAGEVEVESEAEVDATTPQSAAEAWVQAGGRDDGTTMCALQTESFTAGELASAVARDQVDDDASCEDVVSANYRTGQAFGIDLGRATVVVVDETASAATVRVELDGADPGTYAMVLDGDRWLVDERQPPPEPRETDVPTNGPATG